MVGTEALRRGIFDHMYGKRKTSRRERQNLWNIQGQQNFEGMPVRKCRQILQCLDKQLPLPMTDDRYRDHRFAPRCSLDRSFKRRDTVATSCASSATTNRDPEAMPSAPTGVETTVAPASNICSTLIFTPAPYRSGTRHKDAARKAGAGSPTAPAPSTPPTHRASNFSDRRGPKPSTHNRTSGYALRSSGKRKAIKCINDQWFSGRRMLPKNTRLIPLPN